VRSRRYTGHGPFRLVRMLHRQRCGALALLFTGIGFAVLYRPRRTSPRPANDGWVYLLPD